MTEVAGAGPVREEDAINVEVVAQWLRDNAGEPWSGHPAIEGEPEVSQFSGGSSNLTYLLRYAGVGGGDGLDLILRRPPTGTKAKGAHDMAREHRIQAGLRPVFPYVAAMVAYCDDQSVCGSEFYVMERLEGTILRRDVPPELGLDAARVRALCLGAVDRLADLHAVDVAAAGLADLSRGDGYVERQVAGWSERYRRARTDDVDPLEDVMAWLDARRPADAGSCLMHNDYRFDNMVLAPGDPTRILGILDWEMATVGDPLMDLAGALAYWVQADDDPERLALRLQPTHTPGMLTRQEVLDRYAERTGLRLPPDAWAFYEVFGLFRLAVIGQQISYRFVQGQTSNPAYGRFGDMVRYLGRRCRALVAAQEGG